MKKELLIYCLCLIGLGCSTNSDSDNVEVIKNPSSVKLVYPHENSLCNEGTNLTPLESTVLFEWKSSNNTDNYELELKNLSSGVVTNHQTINTEISVVIKRATPYEWFVISHSNSSSIAAKSSTWKFYNAGEGVQSYAPFPAEIVFPLMAETISVNDNIVDLEWTGNDVDNDIINYDVYFGTTQEPSLLQSEYEESSLNNVSVESNTIYYWKIISRDLKGNTSDSGLYQFKIE